MNTAGSFSGHLVDSFMSSHPPTGPFGQPLNISSHGPMSFAPSMHGSANSSFGTQQSFFSEASFMEMSEESSRKIATMQAKLNKKLGPEYISQRPGPGGGPKLTYAEGQSPSNLRSRLILNIGCQDGRLSISPTKCKYTRDEARRGTLTSCLSFGFNGWSSNVVNITTDFMDYSEESRRYNVGVTAIVRVTLRDGVFHEDVGYGLLENSKSKGAALDKVRNHCYSPRVMISCAYSARRRRLRTPSSAHCETSATCWEIACMTSRTRRRSSRLRSLQYVLRIFLQISY